jgi:hypothetical protein
MLAKLIHNIANDIIVIIVGVIDLVFILAIKLNTMNGIENITKNTVIGHPNRIIKQNK